jgi:hypothetical protein
MQILRSTYADAANRLMLWTPLVFPGFAALGLVVAVFVGLPVAIILRDFVGGSLGMGLCIATLVPFIVLPLLLPTAAMVLIDRRIGIRCPNCKVSLTMRCMHQKVLITRKCSHCKSVVLLDDDDESTPAKSQPWLIAILVAIGALGIVAMSLLPIFFPRITPTRDFATASGELAELGALLGIVLVIPFVQDVIIRILKRRWRREAEESGKPSE